MHDVYEYKWLRLASDFKVAARASIGSKAALTSRVTGPRNCQGRLCELESFRFNVSVGSSEIGLVFIFVYLDEFAGLFRCRYEQTCLGLF